MGGFIINARTGYLLRINATTSASQLFEGLVDPSRRFEFVFQLFPSILFLHSQFLSKAKPAPPCTASKRLRGSVRLVRLPYLGRQEDLKSNCVVVLLIVGAIYKGYPAFPVGLQDRFHTCGVRI
jgi:hypothetical protein